MMGSVIYRLLVLADCCFTTAIDDRQSNGCCIYPTYDADQIKALPMCMYVVLPCGA